jgi:hypothetical protein
MTSAVSPPAEVVPATIRAAVVMHAGHMGASVAAIRPAITSSDHSKDEWSGGGPTARRIFFELPFRRLGRPAAPAGPVRPRLPDHRAVYCSWRGGRDAFGCERPPPAYGRA